jgi:hypothetical protein
MRAPAGSFAAEMNEKPRRHTAAWWARLAPKAQSITEVVDPEIDALPTEGRAKLGALWQLRGGLELRVAAGFSALAVELFEHGAPPVVYATVGQAIRDEIHHAEISVEIAARYRGDAPVWPEPAPTHVPPFAPATGALHATLYVIAMCCLNETVACSVLQASINLAKSPLVRLGLSTILADEIEHARAGWGYLGSRYVTAEMKRELPKWIKRLHAAKLREVFEEGLLPGEDFSDHGILTRDRLRDVTHATLVDSIFPGYRLAGIDPSLAEEWAREAFAPSGSLVTETA